MRADLVRNKYCWGAAVLTRLCGVGRAKVEDAISAEIEAAGLAPTDVSFSNAVVQGDRVTIVDFADNAMLY